MDAHFQVNASYVIKLRPPPPFPTLLKKKTVLDAPL